MKEFKDLKPEDISKLVGSVTISFRVKPETKLKLQLAAKKYNTSFAKFCENLMENVLNEKTEKKNEAGEKSETIYLNSKIELMGYLKKNKLPLNTGISGKMNYKENYIFNKTGVKYTVVRTDTQEYKVTKVKE